MQIATICPKNPSPQLIADILKRAAKNPPENMSLKAFSSSVKKQLIQIRMAQRKEELDNLKTINQFTIKFGNEGLSDLERRICELKEQIRLDKAAIMRIDILA